MTRRGLRGCSRSRAERQAAPWGSSSSIPPLPNFARRDWPSPDCLGSSNCRTRKARARLPLERSEPLERAGTRWLIDASEAAVAHRKRSAPELAVPEEQLLWKRYRQLAPRSWPRSRELLRPVYRPESAKSATDSTLRVDRSRSASRGLRPSSPGWAFASRRAEEEAAMPDDQEPVGVLEQERAVGVLEQERRRIAH